ncbi:MAG: heat-inducible transcription repressor HrcA [Clostridia bacterium]|nr:heat-inducible transcription repressor HrcA [Clostridia bacterium]
MLNSRQKEILGRVILTFEKTFEPVGSKSICDDMGLSSATIRNEMSELSRLGFLEQPHTSAGRIPSQSAYRLYINELIKPIPPTDKEKNHIYNAVFSAGNPEILLLRACDALSDVTEHMCITSTPSDAKSYIAKVDLIPIGNINYLLVLLTDSGIVKSLPLRVDEEIYPAEAAVFSSVCARVFSGIPMINIDKATIQGLFTGTQPAPLKFASISDTLRSLIESACVCELKASGEINLFSRGEIEIEKSKKILSMLRSRQLLELLVYSEDNSKVLIGNEMKNEALNTSSLVFEDYSFLDRKGGKIGVIGSTRMQYSKILPIVQFTAKTMGEAISNLFRNDGRNIYVQIR